MAKVVATRKESNGNIIGFKLDDGIDSNNLSNLPNF